MIDRDILMLHAIGCFAFIGGLILLVLTALATLFLGFSGGSSNFTSFVQGALTLALAIVMGASLSSYGLQFMRLRPITFKRHELRLEWTALVLVMTLCLLVGAWLSPPLATLAGLMLLLLFAVRPAVRRLI